jgi:hypothetical protein
MDESRIVGSPTPQHYLNPYKCQNCGEGVGLDGLVETGLDIGGRCWCADCWDEFCKK